MQVMNNVELDVRQSFQAAEEERLNFGLVQVVYEWARNKVSEAMEEAQCTNIHFIYFINFNICSHLLRS